MGRTLKDFHYDDSTYESNDNEIDNRIEIVEDSIEREIQRISAYVNPFSDESEDDTYRF